MGNDVPESDIVMNAELLQGGGLPMSPLEEGEMPPEAFIEEGAHQATEFWRKVDEGKIAFPESLEEVVALAWDRGLDASAIYGIITSPQPELSGQSPLECAQQGGDIRSLLRMIIDI